MQNLNMATSKFHKDKRVMYKTWWIIFDWDVIKNIETAGEKGESLDKMRHSVYILLSKQWTLQESF